MLRRLAAADPRRFTVPDLLHQGEWEAWTSPSARPAAPAVAPRPPPPASGGHLRRDRRPRRDRGDDPGGERLVGPAPVPPGPIRDTLAVGSAPGAAALGSTLERLEGLAGTPLVFGTWHGDWGPWNCARTPGRLLVWDWERSADSVLLGFDLLHFGYQTALGPRPAAGRRRRHRQGPGGPLPGRAGPAAQAWPSCCATCTCWSGSGGPPRPRCRP